MNIYSVLDSDEDEPKKTQPTKKNAPSANSANQAPTTKETNTNTKNQNNQNANAGRGKGPRQAAPAPAVEFETPPERDTTRAKPKHHSRHGEKTHTGAPEKDQTEQAAPRKRQFDRRSGTGRGREVSKDGAGGANWGSDKLEALKGEKHVAGDAELPEESVEVEAETVVVTEAPKEPEGPPEPPVFTLEEHNRKIAAGRAQNTAFSEVSIREVTTDFSGMKTVSQPESVFISFGAAKSQKGKKYQRSTTKSSIDAAFTVKPPEPVRGDRGYERGGDRDSHRPRTGGRAPGRVDGRGPRPSRNGPRVDISDSNAFPVL
jgi:plasminogen activator inhibitor 1 RNA-binding protein